jgi:putative solute:sodium symporter small subunit
MSLATQHAPTRVPQWAPRWPPYWRLTLRITACGLLLWLSATLVLGWCATGWSARFFGWPFGFWATAQGGLLLYCLIVWAYALLMDRLDADHAQRFESD